MIFGLLVALMMVTFSITTSANTDMNYKVKYGDTLWDLSQRFGVSVEALKQTNNLKSNLIIVGQTLKIPTTVDVKSKNRYTVKKGDSLWKIARRYGTSVAAIKRINGIESDVIHVGQTLDLPNQRVKAAHVDGTTAKEDVYWLAKIIEAEAEDEPYLGKVAVGSVVMNRVEHPHFPDTIQAVIFQNDGGVYQFSPVGNGRIHRVEPTAESYRAAKAALQGEDPTGGAMYFYNPQLAKSQWIFSRKVVRVIGRHNFAQ